jgi:hypothetical protein
MPSHRRAYRAPMVQFLHRGVHIAVLATVVGALLAGSAAAKPRELLPDLAQGGPTDVGTTTAIVNGLPQYRLVFQSQVENLGRGPLIVVGTRKPGEPMMSAHQVIRRSGGSSRVLSRPVGDVMYVVAETHQHWHVLGFERYEIWTADGTKLPLLDQKQGFCLGDRYAVTKKVAAKPARPQFPGSCGKSHPELTTVRQGISPGYGDPYRPNLEGQFIDVTTLAPGRYLLVHRTNGDGRIRELNPYNDMSCQAFDLTWPGGTAVQPVATVDAANRECARTESRWAKIPRNRAR